MISKKFLAMFGLCTCLQAVAQTPFQPVDTNFSTTTVIIPPSPLKYDILYVGNHDFVHTENGKDSALAKQNHDFTGFIPDNKSKNKEAWLIVNQEITNVRNDKLGDGGGQTAFKIKKVKSGGWEVIPTIGGKKFHNVDFKTLGGTNTNCGGATTPYGTTLSAEEFAQNSNASLYQNGSGVQDTSDFVIPQGNGKYSGKVIKRWQNYGWMVEADPKTAKGIRKYYSMGRYSHEGGFCMKDGKTVYLTDDNTPGLFFKFVAKSKNNYTEGQLYAYRQGVNGKGGSWLPLPSELDSLIQIREIALQKGATTFTRLEWIVEAPDGKLYISETGSDVANHTSGIAKGASLAYHNIYFDTLGGQPKDNILDYYGRVLEFNPQNNSIRSYIEGGNGSNLKTNFSNPDGLAVTSIDGEDFLVINEDLNGSSKNRQPAGPNVRNNICEIYYLNLALKNPKVDDLKRFAIGPVGAETTGGVFSNDGKTYFVNIQHPAVSNTFPFNNSTTIAITGFEDVFKYNPVYQDRDALNELAEAAAFSIYPNPTSRELHFNKVTDVTIYNQAGVKVRVEREKDQVDISDLPKGVYFIQTIQNEVQKLVVQ